METEIKRGPGRPPKAEAPVAEAAPERKLSVRIKFDTWIGEDRIEAVQTDDEGNTSFRVVELPYEQAVLLLKQGKAERADPLPGM